jgi:uncharacterized protein (DUF433 family)
VRGTRIIADTIVNSFDLGESIEDIAEGYPALSQSVIRRLIEFARRKRQRSEAS